MVVSANEPLLIADFIWLGWFVAAHSKLIVKRNSRKITQS
jgi:hypothetical protein